MDLMKAKKIVSQPEQLQALMKMTVGWKPTELQAEILEKRAFFLEHGGGDGCFDTSVGSRLVSISSTHENLCLAGAFEHVDLSRLAESLKGYVSYRYLHYRLLRILFKVKSNEDLYGLMLDEFGLAACAAIYCGLTKEAVWLGKEFARHMEQGYECPYSIDEEMRNAAWGLVRWYLDGRVPTNRTNWFVGRYQWWSDALDNPSAEPLVQWLDARVQGAYQRLVMDKESPNFYGSIFEAWFPFKMLAFLRLVGNRDLLSAAVAHPAIAHLAGLEFDGEENSDEFMLKVEAQLSELEWRHGLKAVG